jgi:hypothetical protein
MKIRKMWYFLFILSSFLITSYSILDISLTFADDNKKDNSLFSSLSRNLDKTMDGTQNNALNNK